MIVVLRLGDPLATLAESGTVTPFGVCVVGGRMVGRIHSSSSLLSYRVLLDLASEDARSTRVR